jgi:hypothetical protein
MPHRCLQLRFVTLFKLPSSSRTDRHQAQTFGISDPANTIEFGKPSTEVTWSKRDDEPTNPDDVQLGPPTSEIIWTKDKKRAVSFGTPKDTFTISKPKTVVTWGKEKRDTTTDPDTIDLGKPSSEVSWGKRDITDPADPADSIHLGKPSTIITWGKEKRQTLGNPDSETTWGKRDVAKPKDSFKLGKATTVVTWS